VMVQVGRAARRAPMRTTATVILALYAVAMFAMEPLQSLPTSMGMFVLAGAVVGRSQDGPVGAADEPDRSPARWSPG
jgi:hypothetical protein